MICTQLNRTIIAAGFLLSAGAAWAEPAYDTGASDSEIRIGSTMPYSGPASSYGVIGKVTEAYFNKINAEGGINGRKIAFTTYDDGYNPSKTVEQVRKLVERDEVLMIFGLPGTPTNSAVQRYLNGKKIPQLFVLSGAAKWNDPATYPWTMGWQPSYRSEGQIYGKYLLQEKPDAKIGVLYQNDDFGKDLLDGLKDGLGDKAGTLIVAEEAYDVTEPSVASRIAALKGKGVDVFISVTTPKFGAQSIKAVADLGWKPLFILNNVATSIGSVIKPVGFEHAQDIVSAAYAKDVTDPRWNDDQGIKDFDAFLKAYYPDGDRTDLPVLLGYNAAQTLVHVLKAAGDDLTRANIMKQAASISGLEQGGLLPGVTIATGPDDFAPITQLQMMKFKGDRFELFGDIISADATQ